MWPYISSEWPNAWPAKRKRKKKRNRPQQSAIGKSQLSQTTHINLLGKQCLANPPLNSAGGGGKTKRRQEKIQEKNRKLNENRTKRIEREKNAKEESRANGNANQQQQQHLEDAIHPSRRGRVPGNAW